MFKWIRDNKIIAKDKEHLIKLIKYEIQKNGLYCDLNHINISNVKDMSGLFLNSKFNGRIGEWDVSNVKTMNSTFFTSRFNGDISGWDISSVEDMGYMFASSLFNGDISRWDISKVENITGTFLNSAFSQDITNWKPLSLMLNDNVFKNSELLAQGNLPYWAELDITLLPKAIDAYCLAQELKLKLNKKVTHNIVSYKL